MQSSKKTGSTYIVNTLVHHYPSRTLWSSATGLLEVPSKFSKEIGGEDFDMVHNYGTHYLYIRESSSPNNSKIKLLLGNSFETCAAYTSSLLLCLMWLIWCILCMQFLSLFFILPKVFWLFDYYFNTLFCFYQSLCYHCCSGSLAAVFVHELVIPTKVSIAILANASVHCNAVEKCLLLLPC